MPENPWRTPSKLWLKLKPLARQMRHEPTPAECALWNRLRRNQLGAHFRRQHSIDRFIVDFYSAEAELVIEVDGPVHDAPNADAERQAMLEAMGLRVLRIRNEELAQDIEGVIARIKHAIRAR
jgi:very-short-patch-repair endonuclease